MQFHKNFLVVQNHYICGIRWPIEVKRRFKKVKCVGNSELSSFKNLLDYETVNWPQVISFYDATEELLSLIYSTKYVFIPWWSSPPTFLTASPCRNGKVHSTVIPCYVPNVHAMAKGWQWARQVQWITQIVGRSHLNSTKFCQVLNGWADREDISWLFPFKRNSSGLPSICISLLN